MTAKRKVRFLFWWVCALLFVPSAYGLGQFHFTNRIEGRVFDPEGIPVENVYVELRNEVDSVIAQTKTNASGRFTFIGMPGGRYTIKVLPLATNFNEQTQEIFISNLRPNSNDTAYADFYLTYNKRFTKTLGEKSPEAIFVQDVPPAAKKFFDDGAGDLKRNLDTGYAKLDEALKIFPDYFDALSLMGKVYILNKNYSKAYPYLLRAIDVNPRNFGNFFRLGYAFYQIGQYPAALKAAKAATDLDQQSADAQQLYGTLLRINGDFPEAEKALVKANSLAKGKIAEIHWQLALLYNRLKQNQKTIDELETYLRLEPDPPEKNKIQELIVKLKSADGNSKH